ncbi:Ribosomal RNA small subunit methyltransferase E [Acholeplasma oculi]|nr:16S rRNA (uracil1498-N3)-methyltransferase [Acholeplasma oculi]SUT89313.1 Ribosomal RNA small subunit methyltransferase E [Acholeplasma oculi]
MGYLYFIEGIMQRYFLENNEFSKDDLHHILNVMRFKSSDQVEICMQDGCYLSTLKIEQKNVSFEIIEKLKEHKSRDIMIIQGLPKGDKMEIVTKYATLFGATSIYFMPMKRSIAKLSNEDHKLNRFIKISKEAAELSKRQRIPHIDFIKSVKELNTEGYVMFLLDEEEKNYTLDQAIQAYPNEKVLCIIGPEGGIDGTERKMFLDMGVIPLSLGNYIFPTELAHIPFLNAFSL